MNIPIKTHKSYVGEEVIKSITYQNGEQIKDTVVAKFDYSITNRGYAIVLGNGSSRLKLTLDDYMSNNGGLRNKNKAEVYGCNAVYRNGDVNHLVITNKDLLDQAIQQRVYNRMPIYSTYNNWIRYADNNKVRIIPQKVLGDAGTLAMYLACFHGSHNVYLVGFDGLFAPNVYKNTEFYSATDHKEEEWNKWLSAQKNIMEIYSNVNFIHVVPGLNYAKNSPWSTLKNLQRMTYNDFINSADIGKIVTY